MIITRYEGGGYVHEHVRREKYAGDCCHQADQSETSIGQCAQTSGILEGCPGYEKYER